MNKENYKYYTEHRANKSPLFKDCALAFLIGGTICTIAEVLLSVYLYIGINNENAKLLVTLSLIFATCFFTGIGIFDRLSIIGGAGTFVPITGFANAVVSPAIDYTAEGLVMGVGANMFKIAGPVIVYGTLSSIVYGFIYWFIEYA